jgi:hypothetical protein
MDHQTAYRIARAAGCCKFDRHGYDAKTNAQRNLSGRTHYVDPDTLRFFHSRLVHTEIHAEGLLFALVESVAEDMGNTTRGFRFVMFDLFGTVINDRKDTLHRTSDKARQALAEWLEAFDVADHYRKTLRNRAERMQREAADLLAAAEQIGEPA